MRKKRNSYLDTILENFRQLTEKSDSFLGADITLQEKIKSCLKQNYDFSIAEEIKFAKSDALPQLIVKHFDAEQIWQQLELQNEVILAQSIKNVSQLITTKEQLIFKNIQDKVHNIEHAEKGIAKTSPKKQEFEMVENISASNSESETLELDLSEQDSDKESYEDKPRKNKKSSVEDDFFKLDEMENFLNKEEKKLQDVDVRKDSNDSESEEEGSIDLFVDNISDEDDKVKTAKFKDFFVAEDRKSKSKVNKFLKGMSDSEDEGYTEPKSTLESRQERLQKRIEEIEQTAVSEKPWQLKGEVIAENRPYNSLLEEVVEFDFTSKPAPIITEQTNLQLEDVIRQRIKDKAFDSVIRKSKPVETPLEYKKKLVLDQEKSKHSLAQLYEKEFLDQQAAVDPENADKEESEPELHKEIRQLMGNLFNKLDALSNFHFTPKPAIPELKIVNNLPAISMEEVAPVAASDAALLAPEEVKNKVRGELIGKSERTDTDKKRERRKKKQKQRAHLKEKRKHENVVNKIKPGLGNKYSKERAKNLLERVSKDTNVDKMDESVGSKSIKSSRAFFTQLQEEVQTHVNKVHGMKRKKNKAQLEAKKLKL